MRIISSALVLCVTFVMLWAVGTVSSRLTDSGDGSGTEAVRQEAAGMDTINTTSLAKDVIGYGGSTPLVVIIGDGRIAEIQILPNDETPSFQDCVEEELLPLYIGKTPEEAAGMTVDAVSGATFTSKAVIANMNRALAEYTQRPAKKGDDVWTWKLILAIAVALSGAIVPLRYKDRRYRLVQMVLNVVVLGLISGVFVSYTSMFSLAKNGLAGPSQTALLILMFVALVFPLLGRRGHYCAWNCPLGSLQELTSKANPWWKWHMSSVWQKRLTRCRVILWAALMMLTVSGLVVDAKAFNTTSWMNWELFSAFIWQSSEIAVLCLAVLMLVLSLFVSRPYCRFVCPTGTLLKFL